MESPFCCPGAKRHDAALALLEQLQVATGKYAAQVSAVRSRRRNGRGSFDLDALVEAVRAAERGAATTGDGECAVAEATAHVAPYVDGVALVAAAEGGPSRRRSLAAAKPFAAGDVVLAEKALAWSRPRDAFHSARGTLVLDPERGARSSALDDVAATLAYSLPGDALLAARLRALNGDAVGDDVLKFDDADLDDASDDADLSLDDIRAIVHAHAVSLRARPEPERRADAAADAAARGFDGAGLFLLASFLAPDATPNTTSTVYGDLLVVQASRPIDAGAALGRAATGGDDDEGASCSLTWAVCA